MSKKTTLKKCIEEMKEYKTTIIQLNKFEVWVKKLEKEELEEREIHITHNDILMLSEFLKFKKTIQNAIGDKIENLIKNYADMKMKKT